MAIPEGWKRDPNDPDIYTATQTVAGRKVKYTLNARTGDYSGRDARAVDPRNPAAGADLFSYTAGTDSISYQDSDFKTALQSDNAALSTIKNTILKRADEINKDLSQTEGSGITNKDREDLITQNPGYDRVQGTVEADDPGVQPTQATTTQESETVKLANLVGGISIEGKNDTRRIDKPLTYPVTEGNKNPTQDYIQFTIGNYKPKDLKTGNSLGTIDKRNNKLEQTETFATINLPIQPSIVDSNSVDWNGSGLNPLQLGGLQAGVDIMDSGGAGVTRSIDRLKKAFTDEKGNTNTNIINAGKLLLAQEAVGAQNVLSRFSGGIVNPNLELLFSGPQLRPFNFNFRLSPRGEEEAIVVRKIIRAFKEYMAPKVTGTGLFLAAPNIFGIRYVQAGGADHPSLNRIKLCALKSCVVDYTPEGSYMTFKDGSNTMVSYNMSLAFQELEPVTDADYGDLSRTDEIGY